MSRLFRLCQCLTVVGGWLLAAFQSVSAQPTLISERKNGKPFYSGSAKSFELPGKRFVHCGDAFLIAQNNGKTELTLVVSTATGDTVRYRKTNLNLPNGGDYFVDVVLGPDYSLTYL